MYAELLANGKTVEEIASFHNKSVEEIKAILQLEV
jgi:hypothetical protein